MRYPVAIPEKAGVVMQIRFRYVSGHVEAYDAAGRFLFSADTMAEAYAIAEEA